MRKPGIVKHGLLNISEERVYLLAGLMFSFFAAKPVNRGLYPAESMGLKMLEKKPQHRFQTMDELIKVLNGLNLA